MPIPFEQKLDKIIATLSAIKNNSQLHTEEVKKNLLSVFKNICNDLEEEVAIEEAKKLHQLYLKNREEIMKMLNDPAWPPAVDLRLICDPNSENDKIIRAAGILELVIKENLYNKKFLDYGCGEGHCVKLINEYGCKLALGYDIKAYPGWKQYHTTDFNFIKNNAPYDTILLFDVLDHLIGESPVDVLKKLKDILSENGTIYVRVHPFCSRHAFHNYHSLNKAYVHLVLPLEDIQKLCQDDPYVDFNHSGVVFPKSKYEAMFKEAGLKVKHTNVIREEVEPFFKEGLIGKFIQPHFKMNHFPEYQLSIQFIDYALVKQEHNEDEE